MRVNEVLIVEGKYDAARLSGIVEGLILTTGGFSIYRDEEKRELIKTLGKKRGIIILTDSDAAGFRIRNYIQNFAKGAVIKNAYVPAVVGKESRKSAPSKEGTLGVEGLPNEVILQALRRAGATESAARAGRQLTYTDLYELGLSGKAGSSDRRRRLLSTIGMPARLSKKALLEALSCTYTYEELAAIARQKPVIFWDFHGTLTERDHNWSDLAFQLLSEELGPGAPQKDDLHRELRHACLPWWVCDAKTSKTLVGDAWWRFVEEQFAAVFARYGVKQPQAEKLARQFRPFLTNPAAHQLRPDTVSVLAALQQRGYRQYIVSNNFPELAQVIGALGLMPYLSGIVVSGAVGLDKPGADIFRYALQLANDPMQAVMIGDNPDDDVQGAKQAGLGAVGFDRAAESPFADAGCSTLSELLDLFV